ncbi:MAG TPA: 2-isopropylmalate synthase [Chloroflexota bacterium]|jgi:isopropylmalate/homocitrate/citramalate synthase
MARLEDVSQPNLLRAVYPYTAVPRLTFDGREPAVARPDAIWITDTTFRDGQQAREPYSVEQIVRIYDLLARLDAGSGTIRQSEFFLYTQKDREAVRRCRALGHRYPEVTAWIRAVEPDFALVREAGLAETGILTSCSDYHIFKKLGWTRRQALDSYLRIVRAAIEAGVRPRCHFEDVTRADLDGFALPFAEALMRLGQEAGVPIKIRLCDTMGYGVPWAAAALPRSVPKLVRAFVEQVGVPAEQLEWHGHNDFFKVHANSTAAWLYGCAAVNTTLLSTGERTGNSPLEGALIELLGLTGRTDLDTTLLTDIAEYMRDACGVPLPANYPLLGSEFNVTRAGVHIDGLLKDEEIYNVFDTAALLKRPIGVTINDKSGAAGVAYWLNAYYHLDGAERLAKGDPRVRAIHAEIVRAYDAGRTAGMSPAELVALAGRHLPELATSRATV